MKSKKRFQTMVLLAVLMAMTAGAFSVANAEVPKDKRLPLESVLKSSFRERDSDQRSYKANDAASRPDEQQARNELKSISIEIGDELAGKGTIYKRSQPL